MTLSKIREKLEKIAYPKASMYNVSPTRVLAKEALSSLEAYEARERKMCDAVEKALAVLKDMYSMELAEPEIMHNLEQTLNEIKKC